MDFDRYLAHLTDDGTRLADAAQSAGWDAEVVACKWDVRALVMHTGGVHRWAADIVRTAARSGDTEAGRAVGTGPADDGLLAWFREGHAELVRTLRAAPDDLDCFTFLPAPNSRTFWARRQAHETAIHRADAESAAGAITPFAADFAQDGIGEILHGFATRKSNAIAQAGVLALHAADGPSWRVTVGGERIRAEEDAATDADAVVAGTSSDLYLWLWNRPGDVTVSGDETLADAWKKVRVRWS